ncbi:MAG: S9 family peptidase [Candidatus Limnocylindrales bacterium]
MAEPLTFDRYVHLPRLTGLRLSPDGRHLVVTVAGVHVSGTKMASAIWRVDPAGTEAPRRLTRSAAGESGAAFLPDGSLVFTSARPDPEAKEPPDEPPGALWHLPADGGEARLLIAPAGGADTVLAARAAPRIAFTAAVYPGSATLEADQEHEKARKEAGVEALLFERYPIRHWDHYLGPRERHAFALDLPAGEQEPVTVPRDLLPEIGDGLEEMGLALTPDGRTVVAALRDLHALRRPHADLAALDVSNGTRRVLTGGDGWFDGPAVSPDGRWVACNKGDLGDPDHAERTTLWLIDLTDGSGRDLTPDLDLWPHSPVWAADGKAVFFSADQQGHEAAFRLDLASGAITCLVAEGSLSDLCPSPDGRWVYALRSTLRVPEEVVRFDASSPRQTPTVLPSPAATEADVAAPGVVERLEAHAADGTLVPSWLVRPAEASAEHPVPLVVFVHGGPLGSWHDGWQWRWNAQLLAARGYAVLLPDPAISTGYGQAYIQRGWGRWGAEPFSDVMTAVDGALERPDLDASRTALMGGSFGGYMANWVAGHTDRFRCIVTHASLWELRGFHGTTDSGAWWELEMGDPYRDPSRYVEHSPAEHIGAIRTPLLVVHGERDARVPISEAWRLWTDLQRHGVPSRFLYFPDENHWVLKPQNARLWYATVLAFLDEHVLGAPWQRPDLL